MKSKRVREIAVPNDRSISRGPQRNCVQDVLVEVTRFGRFSFDLCVAQAIEIAALGVAKVAFLNKNTVFANL